MGEANTSNDEVENTNGEDFLAGRPAENLVRILGIQSKKVSVIHFGEGVKYYMERLRVLTVKWWRPQTRRVRAKVSLELLAQTKGQLQFTSYAI